MRILVLLLLLASGASFGGGCNAACSTYTDCGGGGCKGCWSTGDAASFCKACNDPLMQDVSQCTLLNGNTNVCKWNGSACSDKSVAPELGAGTQRALWWGVGSLALVAALVFRYRRRSA